MCLVSAYRNRKVQLNIRFVTKDWVHSQSSCRVNRRQRLMREDFKNKFSNNRRVFSFNHLYVCFFARYFYLRGRRETGKLPSDFRGKGGGAAFWQTVNPVINIIIFYLFFAYTLCRVSIKNSTAATVIGLAKRVYVQSALKTRRYLCVYIYIKHFGCRYVFAFAQFTQTPEDVLYYIVLSTRDELFKDSVDQTRR